MSTSRLLIWFGGLAGIVAAVGACSDADVPTDPAQSQDALLSSPNEASTGEPASAAKAKERRTEESAPPTDDAPSLTKDPGATKHQCEVAEDCYGQGIITPQCVGAFTCEKNQCRWECEVPPVTDELVKCGTAVCAYGEVCCNSSCGICTKPGDECIQKVCGSTM